jgi:Cytochrome c554 and c-prime
MAHALLLPADNSVLKNHPDLSFRRGVYTYNVQTRGTETTYSVTDGAATMSVPVRWSFGVGSQTWVLEKDGKLFESLVSYYPGAHGLDTTIGDNAIEPKSLIEAFGRPLDAPEYKACFGCHATGAVTKDQLHLESLSPGVSCARCHTGAEQHQQDVVHGKLQSVPVSIGKLTSEEISNLCGQCHRTWETVVRDRLRGPINVRFQPYRLANSKCFDGSDPRISCVTCHDPHQNPVRETRSYDEKCLACHASGALVRAVAAKPKLCPVAKSNCALCHMPKVDLPGGHRAFTDHQIRIVRANESYPD